MVEAKVLAVTKKDLVTIKIRMVMAERYVRAKYPKMHPSLVENIVKRSLEASLEQAGITSAVIFEKGLPKCSPK